MEQICLRCGFVLSKWERRCPKCDNRLDLQHDGSTVSVDIAHQGERVGDALQKLHREIKSAKSGVTQYLRLIVGTGVIREEVMSNYPPAKPGALDVNRSKR